MTNGVNMFAPSTKKVHSYIDRRINHVEENQGESDSCMIW